MKVNELVWKKMSLCESESESSFVDQVGQTSSGECKANNLNSASSRYFECTVFTILHHCIVASLHRTCPGQGVWSGHFGRDHFQLHKEVEELFLYSNSDYYLPQKYLESEVLQRRRKEGARFSATRWPIRYFFWYSPPPTQIFWLSARAALAEAS